MREIRRVSKGEEWNIIKQESKKRKGVTYFAMIDRDDARNNGYQDFIPDDMDFETETLLIIKFTI